MRLFAVWLPGGTEDGCEPVKHDFKTTEIEVWVKIIEYE